MKGMAQQSDETVEPKQTRSAAFNRQVRPLPLRFDAQVGAALFEGHFNRPALDEIKDNGKTGLLLISREIGTYLSFACWISSDDPADRQGRLTGSIP